MNTQRLKRVLTAAAAFTTAAIVLSGCTKVEEGDAASTFPEKDKIGRASCRERV